MRVRDFWRLMEPRTVSVNVRVQTSERANRRRFLRRDANARVRARLCVSTFGHLDRAAWRARV